MIIYLFINLFILWGPNGAPWVPMGTQGWAEALHARDPGKLETTYAWSDFGRGSMHGFGLGVFGEAGLG